MDKILPYKELKALIDKSLVLQLILEQRKLDIARGFDRINLLVKCFITPKDGRENK